MAELTEYLEAAKSSYHVVEFAASRLKEAGFEELSFRGGFDLKEGGAYYCIPYPTSLFAFRIAEKVTGEGMHIACAHTDSPTFRIKPSPDMGERAGTCRINVEPYGGALRRTWFDRGLGVAGTVYIKGEDPFKPVKLLFDSEKAWFVIPSLAPHMDREIEERKLDPQKEIIPVFMGDGSERMFLSCIADKAGVNESDILDYDLELYLCEKPEYVGPGGELLLSARIDNIASVAALTEGIISGGSDSEDKNDIALIALYDNEEIGSRTKQGADSNILNMIAGKIFESSLYSTRSLLTAMSGSRMISVDGAHAQHPNYPEKADETARVYLGKGIVFKSSASQRYVTDPEMGAVLSSLCAKNDIAFQRQANRSGAPGGQTLGPIVSSFLPIPAADMGIPMLAMHSVRETMCLKDYDALKALSSLWLGTSR